MYMLKHFSTCCAIMNKGGLKVQRNTKEWVRISLFSFFVHLSFAQILNMDLAYTVYITGHMEIVSPSWKLEL